MKTTKIIALIPVLLLSAVQVSFGQYFSKLYDYDSTYDWGSTIFLRPDNSYFVNCTTLKNSYYAHWHINNAIISSDGNTVVSWNDISAPNSSIFTGDFGQLCPIGGGFITTATTQTPDSGGNLRSNAGFMRLDSVGDTIFIRQYTDTSLYFDGLYSCALTTDGKYLAAGFRGFNGTHDGVGFLVKADTTGDTIWTHSYRKLPWQFGTVRTVSNLPDGRLLLGACSGHTIILPPYSPYTIEAPWFIITDTGGHILKDTLYSAGFMGSGRVYPDKNGGYIHWGSYDSVVDTADLNQLPNFPLYLMHLDTNFRSTWVFSVPFSFDSSKRSFNGLKQLRDSSYLVYGCKVSNYRVPRVTGWAARISPSGVVLWDKTYINDSSSVYESYLIDVAERADGSLIFTGSSGTSSLPSWHTTRDMWLLSTDANGCETMSCALGIHSPPAIAAQAGLQLFPNPTTGSFTLRTTDRGLLTMYDAVGRHISSYDIVKDETQLQLPPYLSPGMYIGIFLTDQGTSTEIKIVYQP